MTVVEGEDDELGEVAQRRYQARRSRNVAIGTTVLVGVMAVTVLDGLGQVDAVGVDDATAVATEGPLELSVRYPTVARPALAAPFEISIEHDGGFPSDTVTITLNADYLAIWDLNGIVPAPSAETAEGDLVVWEVDAPEGDVLTVVVDARIEPARQEDADGRVAVLAPSGEPLAAVEFQTHVRP